MSSKVCSWPLADVDESDVQFSGTPCPRFSPNAIWIVTVSRETIASVRARRGCPAFKCEPTLDNNEIAQASKGNF
jgi:hypothetical protein